MANRVRKAIEVLALSAIFLTFTGGRLWSKARESRNMKESPAKSAAMKSGSRFQVAHKPKTAKTFGNVPMQFEANRGQSVPQVQFISRGSGYSLFLTSTEAVIVLNRPKRAENGHKERNPHRLHMAERGATQTSIVRMKLLGSNPIPQIAGTEKLAGTINYFIGRDAEKWKTGIPTYSAVEYTAVYPGIDLVFYGNNHQLEYDFVLQPGADPRKIALDFAGTKNLAVDSAGNLAMETEAGKLTLFKPLVYQMVGGEKKQIRGGYVLHQDHSVGLDIGAHDSTKALVVDPVLVYSSYLGGSGWDSAVSVKVDATGNTYLGGFTISPDFPATTMISAEPGGNCVGFITKLDPTLSTVLFSSFFGGTNGITNCLFGDGIYSIAVDSLGQTYATGFASSTDFPITADSAFQPAMGAGATENAFISKLSADGQTMLYSSYLGGSGGNDDGYAVVLDASANAYVVGQANPNDSEWSLSSWKRFPYACRHNPNRD